MIAQKFGGTSLGKKGGLKRATTIVVDYLKQDTIVVTVSALSDQDKKEGTTTKLLEAAQLAVKNKGGTQKIIQELQEKHFLYLHQIKSQKIKENCYKYVEKKLTALKEFLKAISIIGEMTHKSEDNILSVGEQLSAKIFAAFLEDRGVATKAVDLANLIKGNFIEADYKFFLEIEKKLKEYQTEAKEKVLIFTGFLGNFPHGILANLGRGYTDFTACLLATAFRVKELQIWKEVDGVFSADPNLIRKTKLLTSIHPEEAEELTYYGSEVIHPSAISYITQKPIPIHIKNTFDPEGEGTLVDANNISVASGAVAITCKKNILVLNIHSNKMLMAYGFMRRLFDIFSKYKIIIDIIATSKVNVSLTLNEQELPSAMMQELNVLGKVTINTQMSIISLVGRGLRQHVGSAGKMFSILASGNINIEVISQGSSEINISCVVCTKDADKALRLLHQEIIADID